LEIRLPTDQELCALVALTDEGVHDPATMPFCVPWTDAPPERRRRESLQWWWHQRADWRPDNWSFTGGVFVDGRIVGVQDLAAKSFAQLRVVSSASWLGRAYQGMGLGKEMRAAILHLAFEGLGAEEARSGAFPDNQPSLAVSAAMGYVEDGHEVVLRRGRPAHQVRLCLDRQRWAARRREDIVIEGLDGCLAMFGVEP
jgi:RimJ/RimL family protein N-acetyltransferase